MFAFRLASQIVSGPQFAAPARAVLRSVRMISAAYGCARWMRRLPLVAGAVLAAAAAGCAIHRVAPPAPPVAVRPAPGYERLADSLSAVDATGLRGRRIALDPGHGGTFRGAVGLHGLTEAEVNLGVALRLRDLLVAHGAQVFLTRDHDRDFLSPADSSLRADLAERMRLANEFGPDLFLSIHHNADPAGARNVNETQTYARLDDPGPSADAAEDVHHALVRNLGIAANRLLPGNYFVLRTSAAPGLLTEASYLSDPDVEDKLRLPASQELEADALFVGLARFFARRAPRIDSLLARTANGVADTSFAGADEPCLEARIAGPFDRATLTLDGVELPLERHGGLVTAAPALPLEAGPHEAELSASLGGEGAARSQRLRFTVRRPVARLAVSVEAGVTPGARLALAAVRVGLEDAWGRPVADSVRVRLLRVTGMMTPRDTVVTARGGEAWGYLRAMPERGPVVRGRAGSTRRGAGATNRAASAATRVPAVAARYRAELVAGNPLRVAPVEFAVASTSTPPAARPGQGSQPWACFALRMPGDVPLADSTRASTEPGRRTINRDGFCLVALDTLGAPDLEPPAGFRRWAAETPLPPRFVAVAGGALAGHRIVLDPEGGGDDPAGVGPGGTRAAPLNLEVARILEGFLRAAGARVALTRRGTEPLSEVARVRIGEAFHAERYLRIGHRAEPPRFGHYYASDAGRRWGQRAARELDRLGLPAPIVREEAMYALQQTSSTALFASPARVDRDEARLLAPGALRAEAYALYVALAREWAGDTDWPADSIEVRDDSGRPTPRALVEVGGLLLETDAGGRVRFARTEAGPLDIALVVAGAITRRILLDSDRGVVLTGPNER